MADWIRWGILGTGRQALLRFIPGVAASCNGVVAAIASRDQGRAKNAASQLGIEQAYGSYEALPADPGVAAVYSPLPNSMHGEWTLRAAEAGKPVLCEKPPCSAFTPSMPGCGRCWMRARSARFIWCARPIPF